MVRVVELTDTSQLPKTMIPKALKVFASTAKKFTFYVPFDPNTMEIPSSVLDTYSETEKYRKSYQVGDTLVEVIYSPNVHRIMLMYYSGYDPTKGQYITKLPVLYVDYNSPLHGQYAGTEKPPDRDIKDQYNDWQSGYMLSRVSLPNQTWPEDKLTQYENTYFADPVLTYKFKRWWWDKFKRGWWWVKYHARLIEIPSGFVNLTKDVLIFRYVRNKSRVVPVQWIKDYLRKRKLTNEEVTQGILALLGTLGLELDTEPYEYNGKTYRGIAAIVSSDGDWYEVLIPVKRTTGQFAIAPLIPLLSKIVVAVVVLGSLYLIKEMLFAWIEVRSKELDLAVEKLYLTNGLLDTYEKLRENAPTEKEKEQIDEIFGGIFDSLASDPSGDSTWDIGSIVKWGAIGVGLLFGGILLLNLLQFIQRPRRE